MRIDLNYSCLHGMRIKAIQIENGLQESTSTGDLNMNWLENRDSLRHNNAMLVGM